MTEPIVSAAAREEVQLLTQKVESDATDRPSRLRLAELCVEQRDPDRAMILFAEADAIAPAPETESLNWLRLLIRGDARPQAVDFFRRREWKDAAAYNAASRAAFRADDYAAAEETARNGLALHADDLQLRCALARALVATDRTDDAIAECVRMLKMRPAHANALSVWAEALVVAGKVREALAKFDEAVKADPALTTMPEPEDRALHAYMWGQALLAYRRYQQAREKNDMALALDGRPTVYLAAASLQYCLEQWFEAMLASELALEKSVDRRITLIYLILALAKCGMNTQARRRLAELEQADDNGIVPAILRCQLYWGQGRYYDARQEAINLRATFIGRRNQLVKDNFIYALWSVAEICLTMLLAPDAFAAAEEARRRWKNARSTRRSTARTCICCAAGFFSRGRISNRRGRPRSAVRRSPNVARPRTRSGARSVKNRERRPSQSCRSSGAPC